MTYENTGVTDHAADDQQQLERMPENSAPMQEARNVPLAALEDERRKRQMAEQESEMFRSHFQMMKSQQTQQQAEPEISDDDIPTFGQIKKMAASIEQRQSERVQELQMMQKHRDYTEVLNKYLVEAIKENPMLRDEIERSPNKHELAYWAAKKSDAFIRDNAVKTVNSDADRIIRNSGQTGSLASVGQSVPSAPAPDYKSMSDDQFKALFYKQLGQI